jgi:hypothetical protein
MRAWTITVIGALALYCGTAPGHATAIGTAATALRTADNGSSSEKAAFRRCWWRKGHRYCRRYGASYAPYYGGYRYGYSGSIGIILGIQ